MRKLILAILIILCIGVVGEFDHIDGLESQLVYCSNTKDGTWPDFKGLYNACDSLLHEP